MAGLEEGGAREVACTADRGSRSVTPDMQTLIEKHHTRGHSTDDTEQLIRYDTKMKYSFTQKKIEFL